MKSSECQLLAVQGIRRIPLPPSLADRPDRRICACLFRCTDQILRNPVGASRNTGFSSGGRSISLISQSLGWAGRFVEAPKVRHLW